MGTTKKKAPAKPRAKARDTKKPTKTTKPKTASQRLRAGEQVSGEEYLKDLNRTPAEIAAAEKQADDFLAAGAAKPTPITDTVNKRERAKLEDARDRVVVGSTVFMQWDPSGPSNDLFPGAGAVRRGKLVGYTKDGKPKVQMFRVDAHGAYTGELGTEARTFEVHELLGEVHAAILPKESAQRYDERMARGGKPTDAQLLTEVAKQTAPPNVDTPSTRATTTKLRVTKLKEGPTVKLGGEGGTFPITVVTDADFVKMFSVEKQATSEADIDRLFKLGLMPSGETWIQREERTRNAEIARNAGATIQGGKKKPAAIPVRDVPGFPETKEGKVNPYPSSVDPKCPTHGLLLIPTRSKNQRVCPAPGSCGFYAKKLEDGSFTVPQNDDAPSAESGGGLTHVKPDQEPDDAPWEKPEITESIAPGITVEVARKVRGVVATKDLADAKCPKHKLGLVATSDGQYMLCPVGDCDFALCHDDDGWRESVIVAETPAAIVDDVLPMLPEDDDRAPWEM